MEVELDCQYAIFVSEFASLFGILFENVSYVINLKRNRKYLTFRGVVAKPKSQIVHEGIVEQKHLGHHHSREILLFELQDLVEENMEEPASRQDYAVNPAQKGV